MKRSLLLEATSEMYHRHIQTMMFVSDSQLSVRLINPLEPSFLPLMTTNELYDT